VTRLLLLPIAGLLVALPACSSDDDSPQQAKLVGTGGSGASGGSGGSSGTGGSSSGSAGKGGGAGSAGASPSDGCAGGSRPARGHYTISVGSATRGYYLIPATTDGPVPLVFEFHGAGGNGEGVVSSFGLESSLQGGAVLIAPDGVDQGGTIGWAGGNSNPDIELVRALIAEAKGDHCIDATRIYALGFSWGGWMASQTACALGSELRAFVSVAGGGPMGSCTQPVAGMIVHGTGDTAEPISAGLGTRDKLRALNGCGDTLGGSAVTGCQEYSGCSEPLLFCQHDGGHYIPDFVLAGLPAFFEGLP
jgi:polyhydroxybutyrate depolymerase